MYSTFDSYTKSCINYLKFLDKRDIIQEKYGNIIDSSCNNCDVDDYDISKCDILFAKEEEVKTINLDTFVVKKTIAESKPMVTTKKGQNVNIKTNPEHITKGILKKKKNITNIYE